MEKNSVYQYVYSDKPLSKRKDISVIRAKVYVQILAIKGPLAHCKIILIEEQPSTVKFVLNGLRYIPVMNLSVPDIYPKYHKQKSRWLKLVKQPIITSALEILEEISPQSRIEVTALFKRDLKVGQRWKNEDKILIIEKQWDKYFITKDKYGDLRKYTPEELLTKIEKEKYVLLKTPDYTSLLKAIGTILIPFIGIGLVSGLLDKFKEMIRR